MRSMLWGAGPTFRLMGWVTSLAVWMAVAGGCVEGSDRYTIAMTPLGDSLERSVRIEPHQAHDDSLRGALRSHLEPGLEDRLYPIYHVSPDTAMTAPYVAHQRFADLPDDIGTRGHYRHRATPLGESFVYAERIRGMDDPAGWIARRFAAADTLGAVTTAWLRFELVTAPEWPRVSGMLEPELQAIARRFTAVTLVADEDSLLEGWLLTLEPEHPLWALMGVPLLPDVEDAVPMEPYLARARADLAFRMGLRSAADEARVLGFLADGTTAIASYRSWTQRGPEARAIEPSVIGRVLWTMMDNPRTRARHAIVTVELNLPQPPYDTNGQWIESLGCVRWEGSCAALSNQDVSLPLTCGAMWSVPDSVTQRRLFGEVVLDEAELSGYADWFTTLPPARQAEWNRMLLALRPDQLGPLDRFRFRNERGTADAAAYGRSLIHDACEQARKRAAAERRRLDHRKRGVVR